jgi:hypothetical protein
MLLIERWHSAASVIEIADAAEREWVRGKWARRIAGLSRRNVQNSAENRPGVRIPRYASSAPIASMNSRGFMAEPSHKACLAHISEFAGARVGMYPGSDQIARSYRRELAKTLPARSPPRCLDALMLAAAAKVFMLN